MDPAERAALARAALGGYPSGLDAPSRATERALARIAEPAAVVLVEGVSDQIAVETLAALRGRDLGHERVVVLPVGGAHAIGRAVARLRQENAAARLAGLYDVGEEQAVRRGLGAVGLAGADMAVLGLEGIDFFACVRDLEDELLRAVGMGEVEALFDSQGDLAAFRALQGQPAWRDRDVAEQAWRFVGSGARRKLRYARLLVEAAAARDRVPRPLESVLRAV